MRVGVSLLLLAGCYSDPNYDQARFRCDAEHDCPGDHVCACGSCEAITSERKPTQVANFTVMGPTSTTAAACNPAAAIGTDGMAAGLPWTSGATADALLAGVVVTSCVEATIDPGTSGGCVRLRWARGDACMGSCTPGMCDFPTEAPVFGFNGATPILLELATLPVTDGVFEDRYVPLAAPSPKITVCRGAAGNARADVLIDSISEFPE